MECNFDAYGCGDISFAELDVGAQGGINHVRYADTWGLLEHVFSGHLITARPPSAVAGEVSPAPPPESEYSEERRSESRNRGTPQYHPKADISVPVAGEIPEAKGTAGAATTNAPGTAAHEHIVLTSRV